MFEIPFNLIVINPVFDIFLFILVIYFFVFQLYLDIYKKESEKIQWLDLKLTLVFVLFGYLNYSEMELNIFNIKLDWLSWVLLLQVIIEGFFVFVYWKEVKEWWGLVNKFNKNKNIKNLEQQIDELNMFKQIIEGDIEQLKIDRKEKAVKQLEKEIIKIDNSISKLKDQLRVIENDKEK